MKLLTPAQVAAELACSVEHVRRLIRDGRIEAMNIGRGKRPTYRIPGWAIAHINKHIEKPPSLPRVGDVYRALDRIEARIRRKKS